jgi:hypothetical protein
VQLTVRAYLELAVLISVFSLTLPLKFSLPFFTAEVGDYCDELADQNYLSTLKLLPNQTPELEYKIMEHHREHL